MSINKRIKQMQQNRDVKKVVRSINNTKRYKAQSETERARQKVLQAEIEAKKELEGLRAKTRDLKTRRGSVDLRNLRKGIKTTEKVLKALDKKLFG